MSEESAKGPNAYAAYMVIAFCGALASIGVAWLVLSRFTHVSDGGMFAIALMVVGPAAMAVAVALFVYKTSRGGIRP